VKRFVKLFAILAPLALMAACSKAPAEASIKSAEQAVDAARPVAEKFVPDQMKTLSDSLAGAKDKFAKGDYAGSMTDSKDIPAKAGEVVAAAKAKKEELTKAWEGLSKDVTASLGAITARWGELAAMKKLPKDMDKAKLDGAKAALDAATAAWGQAAEAAKAGNWVGAMQKGGEVKAKAQEIMSTLGMPAEPAPAK
jgi:hypothetical protein